jgi:predicted nucleotidyltransferase
MLDREQLAAIARQGPSPVFATISGAHLYGFASPDRW